MKRKSLFDIVRQINTVLKKEKELPVKAIADKIGSQWDTTIKSLEFMKEFDLAKERSGKETYKKERLFSLK